MSLNTAAHCHHRSFILSQTQKFFSTQQSLVISAEMGSLYSHSALQIDIVCHTVPVRFIIVSKRACVGYILLVCVCVCLCVPPCVWLYKNNIAAYCHKPSPTPSCLKLPAI